jgi:hypothetical protein
MDEEHDMNAPTNPPEPGTDTPTGTDDEATYDQPGYEDKSFGQAVDADQELVDRLVDDADGDLEESEARFEQESTGAPARERQGHRETS